MGDIYLSKIQSTQNELLGVHLVIKTNEKSVGTILYGAAKNAFLLLQSLYTKLLRNERKSTDCHLLLEISLFFPA
jgi:hypothetical protein